jgi:hypothetical protein
MRHYQVDAVFRHDAGSVERLERMLGLRAMSAGPYGPQPWAQELMRVTFPARNAQHAVETAGMVLGAIESGDVTIIKGDEEPAARPVLEARRGRPPLRGRRR